MCYDNFIISFYSCDVSNVCVLYLLRWLHVWPEHVAVHCVYKTDVSMHLFVPLWYTRVKLNAIFFHIYFADRASRYNFR